MKKRTMIYMEPDLLDALMARARAEGLSLTELFHRLGEDYLSRSDSNSPVPPEVYLRLVGLGNGDCHDVSTRHDDHIGEAIRSDYRQ